MFNIVLFQPEIPPNTGNIMRLCANTGCRLHLIRPLGFSLEDKYLKRANLDYEMVDSIQFYDSFEAFHTQNVNGNFYICTTKASHPYTAIAFKPNDFLIFGSESKGLPLSVHEKFSAHQKIKIPMHANARSLNLSNSVAVIVYEAWRQHNFRGA